MKKITTEKGVFGPYVSVEILDNRYATDRGDLPFTVVGLGTVDDWTGPTDTRDPAVVRSAIKERLSEIARTRRQAGCMVNGMLIATDPESLILLTGGKVGGKGLRKFVTKSGVAIQVTSAQLSAIFDAVDTYVQTVMDRYHDLCVLLDAASTVSDMEAVDIASGWPS